MDATHTGDRAGGEVVQMYVRHLKTKVEFPPLALKGFARVTVQPHQTKTVTSPLDVSTLAGWDEKLAGFRVEAEPIRVMIGDASNHLPLSTVIRVR